MSDHRVEDGPTSSQSLQRARGHRVNGTVRSWIPPRQRRRLLFLRNHGRWGNFKEPRTFSEKVNWRILNDRRPELAWTGDKLEMKARAAAVGVRSPETYWHGESLRTLAEVSLPAHWVLKPNHRSSLVHFGQGDPDIEHLHRLTAGWTEETQSKVLGEWAYSQARPLLLVEEQLEPDRTLFEYKFFVMDGRAEIIQVDVDRFGDHRRNVYTPQWEAFDTRFQWPVGDHVAPPAKLPEMVSAAEHIAGDLDFLRVDLYFVDNVVYFGEVAAYPGSGLVRHRPYSSNVQLGSRWRLPNLHGSDLPEVLTGGPGNGNGQVGPSRRSDGSPGKIP